MNLRRRIAIRLETSARTWSLVAFWLRHGHSLREAWRKAQVTL